MEKPGKAAVVGAGAAGLAAAWTLVRAGVEVTVYEAREAAGGLMRSAVVGGMVVDPAVQLLSSTYGEVHRVAREVGAGSLLVRSPGRDALWLRGKARGLTYGSVSSMASSSALPVGLKLKLAGRYLPFLKGVARGLDVNDPVGSGGVAFDDHSIAAFGRRELGDEFVELLAYPLLATYYGSTPEETSAGLYHALARVGLDIRLVAVRGGVGALARAMVDGIERAGGRFHAETPVERVSCEGAGVEVLAGSASGRFDAVVVAVPPPVVGSLLDLPEPLRAWLGGVRTRPAVTLAASLDRMPKVDWFGLSVPRGEPPGDRLVALCVEGNKGADLVSDRRGPVLAFPAPARAPQLADAPAESFERVMVQAMEEVLPGVARRITALQVYHAEHGYTVFYPGYLRHLAEYRAAWLPAGVALAGAYLVAPTVEGAVCSGVRAAGGLLRS